jgi:DNA polymerase
LSVLSIDFETRSTVDLKKAGVYVYATHPTTDIWLMAWAFDDEEPEVWYAPHAARALGCPDPDAALPSRVVEHIQNGGEIRAWNAAFERIIWREIMVKRYGAPEIAMAQFVDTAAEAAAMSLPRALDQAAGVMGLSQKKDDKGYRLMLAMARPRKIDKDTGALTWWDVAERIERLGEYAKQDVRTERAVMKATRRLTPREREVYLFDQRVNDRGLAFDRQLVIAAQGIADEGAERASVALKRLSAGGINTVTDLNGFKAWLAAQGVDAPSLAKKAMRELMDAELPMVARQALEIRQDVGKASVAKLKAIMNAANADDRLRGLKLYHGAGTGRWSGKLVQPDNFPRPEIGDGKPEEIEWFIPLVLAGDFDGLSLYEPPVVVVSSMLRSMLVAGPGHDLVAADAAAIEARIVNWLAGQEDVLDMFARGEDVYSYNAARMPGQPPYEKGKKHPKRQAGKFQELGCGFGMGWKKAVSAAKDVYGLDLTDEEAKEIVDSYRSTHAKVKELWDDSNAAVLDAVANPGKVIVFGGRKNLKAVKKGSYLYIILPSGRPLAYPAPKIVDAEMPWSTPGNPQFKLSVEFSGIDSRPGAPKKWTRLRLYGGLIVENIVQAVARNILVEAMMRAEERGYPTVMHVHDEGIFEVPEGFGSVKELEAILAERPKWALDLPIAWEGWRGKRYRK